MLVEGQEFPISRRPPGKGINAIKSLDVIDPEQMKDPSGSAHPFTPPLKIVRALGAPAIHRNAPVLSPFLRKRVVLEMWLGRSAAEPVEHEFIRTRENVGAVVTDTEGNVAHQRDAAFLSMRFHIAPLLVCDPLHVTEEIQALYYDYLFVLREFAYP